MTPSSRGGRTSPEIRPPASDADGLATPAKSLSDLSAPALTAPAPITEPRRRSLATARAIDVGAPALLLGIVATLVAVMPNDLGLWQTDRIVVAVLGAALTGALLIDNRQRRRRGQSLGMAAVGLVETDGLGVRHESELRRVGIEVDTGLARPPRRWPFIFALLTFTVAVGLIAVAVGARGVTMGDVVGALVGGDGYNELVIAQRLPRALVAAAAGLALGMAGAIIQCQTNNPLADPDLMGITRGATFAAVLAIWLGGLGTPGEYGWFALGGGLIVAVIVTTLAESIGSGIITLPLVGAAIAAVLSGATGIVLLLNQTVQQSFRQWMIGGLSDRPIGSYWMPLAAIGVGLVLAIANAPALNALSMGSDIATSLGTDVRRSRIVGLLTVGVLVGAATAACGPIAFLGLIAPHTARALVGNDYRLILPTSALVGASALLFADIVGRVIARPSEIQAGIIFAIFGAPLFVALARSRSGARS